MGYVYQAKDTRLERVVAIKVLPDGVTTSPRTLERFQREARAASSLNHPNICTIYDVGTHPPFIAMELLEGETLEQRLTKGAMDATELVDDAVAIADALEAAHANQIVHRDIKPANIFLTAHGPKILDFGLATSPGLVTAVVTSQQATVLTDPGSTVGTIAYMSPEQLRGEPLDARTDLFSFGLVLYEMVSGRPAFSGPTNAVISAAILHDDPSAPCELRGDLPARLNDLLLKLLEKDRDDRYQTAGDLRADLRRLKRELESHPSHSAVVGSSAAATSGPSTAIEKSRPPSSDAQIVAAVAKRHGRLLAAIAAV